jgi:hypothetical protein
MKGRDVGYSVLCHPFDLRQAGSINSSTGVEGVVGVESCTKRKQIALSYYYLWPARYDQVKIISDGLFNAARGIRQQRL